MAVSRYHRSALMDQGRHLSTTQASKILRSAVENGQLATSVYTIKPGERLDVLAAKVYGNGSLWWVIAGASAIGWWVQVPPGVQVIIPTDLGQVEGLFA